MQQDIVDREPYLPAEKPLTETNRSYAMYLDAMTPSERFD
jgi:hypothetical protein